MADLDGGLSLMVVGSHEDSLHGHEYKNSVKGRTHLSVGDTDPGTGSQLRQWERNMRCNEVVGAQIHLWGSGLPGNPSHRQVTASTPRGRSGRWTEEALMPPLFIRRDGFKFDRDDIEDSSGLPCDHAPYRSIARNLASGSRGGENNRERSVCARGCGTWKPFRKCRAR